MKKILIVLTMMLFSFGYCSTDWNSESALLRVNTIGNKLLKSSNVNYEIEFKVSDQADINAYANINKEIYVYRGLLEYVDDDNELAGVISHEIGHIINGHCAKQGILDSTIASVISTLKVNETAKAVGQQLASSKISRSDEFEADLTGVDLMIKAGYNPLAMISLLNKISGNYIDILQTHPSGEKRLQNIYDYVEYNYNSYVKTKYDTDSYQKAMLLIQPVVDKRQKSSRLMNKYEKNQQKLLKKKEKRAKKMQGTNSFWDGYYTTLQYLAS